MDYRKIREARKAAGKSQEDLAQFLRVNRATISKYESGIIEPSISQLARIARYLDVDFSEFLDDEKAQFYRAYNSGFNLAVQIFGGADAAQSGTIRGKFSPTDTEARLLQVFNKLNPDGQQKAVERVEELTEIPKYQKKPPQD